MGGGVNGPDGPPPLAFAWKASACRARKCPPPHPPPALRDPPERYHSVGIRLYSPVPMQPDNTT
eukprot:1250032-Pyramimonas_sp.AAC.1